MASGAPDFSPRIITSASADEDLTISATDVDSTATFAQTVQAFVIYNDGPNPVHFRRGAAATTSYFKIPSKAWFSEDVPSDNIHFICASGETAEVFIKGVF